MLKIKQLPQSIISYFVKLTVYIEYQWNFWFIQFIFRLLFLLESQKSQIYGQIQSI